MTSIDLHHAQSRPRDETARDTRAGQRFLLAGGILAPLVYVATDLIAAMMSPGYSPRDQAVSELSAIGAPTAGLWSLMSLFFGPLLLAFAVGVLRAAKGNRALRATGWLLLLFGATGILWWFMPMHPRGAERTWQDTGHLVMTVVSIILVLCYITTGAFALGRRFRTFSFATIVAVLGGGVVGLSWAPRIAAMEPTPWLGFVERICVYGYLLWIAVLALALLRHDYTTTDHARARTAPR